MPRSRPSRARQREQSRGCPRSQGKSHPRKLSEVLLEFLEPYACLTEDARPSEALLLMGVTAWNIAVLPEHEREPMTRKALNALTEGGIRISEDPAEGADRGKTTVADHESVKRLFHELIGRKLRCYPDDRRFVADFELSETRKRTDLTVSFLEAREQELSVARRPGRRQVSP